MTEPHVHIYAPQPTMRTCTAGYCPDCKKRTRFLAWFVEWFGWDQICLRCGREWQDGQWTDLPFTRGARQKNLDAAKRRWRKGMKND